MHLSIVQKENRWTTDTDLEGPAGHLFADKRGSMERLLLSHGDSGTKLKAQRKPGGSQAQPVSLSVVHWLCHRYLTTPL